jgi:hypothetical protein
MRTDGQTETDRNTEVNKEFNSHFSQTFFWRLSKTEILSKADKFFIKMLHQKIFASLNLATW